MPEILLVMCAGWVEKHKAKTPGNRVLQQQLDEWMEQWETQEKQRHDTATAAAEDEGWTVVTKQRVSCHRPLIAHLLFSLCVAPDAHMPTSAL